MRTRASKDCGDGNVEKQINFDGNSALLKNENPDSTAVKSMTIAKNNLWGMKEGKWAEWDRSSVTHSGR